MQMPYCFSHWSSSFCNKLYCLQRRHIDNRIVVHWFDDNINPLFELTDSTTQKLLCSNLHMLDTGNNYIETGPQQYLHFASVFYASVFLLSRSPSSAYMRRRTGSPLVQAMSCRLFGNKPLHKPMLTYCQLDPCVQTSVVFAFGAITCEMAAVFSRKRCFNTHFPGFLFLDDNTIEVHGVQFTIRKQEPLHLAMIRIASQRWIASTVILKDMNDTGRYLAKIRNRKNVNHVHTSFCSIFWPQCGKGYDAPDPVLCIGVICFLLFFINVFQLWFVYFGKNCLFLMWIIDWLMCCHVRIQLKTYVGLTIIVVYNTKGLLK